jgi:hypothetical protein
MMNVYFILLFFPEIPFAHRLFSSFSGDEADVLLGGPMLLFKVTAFG